MSGMTETVIATTTVAQKECEVTSVQDTLDAVHEPCCHDEPSTPHGTLNSQYKRAREEDEPTRDAARSPSGRTTRAVESEASTSVDGACTTPSSTQPQDKPRSPTPNEAVCETTDAAPQRDGESHDAACVTETQGDTCVEGEVTDAGTPPPPSPRSPSLGAEVTKCDADVDALSAVAADAKLTTPY